MIKLSPQIVTSQVLLTIHLGGIDRTTILVDRLDYIAAYNGSKVAQDGICQTARMKINTEENKNITWISFYDGLVSRIQNNPAELRGPQLFDPTPYMKPPTRVRPPGHPRRRRYPLHS